MPDRRLPSAVALPGFALIAAVAATPAPASAQSWRTVTQTRQVAGERDLDVRVRYAAGQFLVRPADEGVLYHMSLRYDEDSFDPVSEYRNGRLRLGLEGTSKKIQIEKGESAGHLQLELARSVPMDLELEFGAVQADLDLGGLALTHLEMTTGASETRLDVSQPNPVSLGTAELKVGAAKFRAERLGNLNAARILVDAGVGDITLDLTGRWQQDARVSVDMGLGALELRVPEGLGVRLTKDSFLAKVDAGGMIKRGDSYYSAGYDEAEHHVDVDIDASFGTIKVVMLGDG